MNKVDVHRVYRKLDRLIPDMQLFCRIVDMVIFNYELPFKRFETWRHPDRQLYLFDRGYSNTTIGKHPKGEAADYVHYQNHKETCLQ